MRDWAADFTPVPTTPSGADVSGFTPAPVAPVAETGGYPVSTAAPSPGTVTFTPAPTSPSMPASVVSPADPTTPAGPVPANRNRNQYDEDGLIQRDENGQPILTAPAP